jgi:hypothetical protein
MPLAVNFALNFYELAITGSGQISPYNRESWLYSIDLDALPAGGADFVLVALTVAQGQSVGPIDGRDGQIAIFVHAVARVAALKCFTSPCAR